jgi:hypothetical protein
MEGPLGWTILTVRHLAKALAASAGEVRESLRAPRKAIEAFDRRSFADTSVCPERGKSLLTGVTISPRSRRRNRSPRPSSVIQPRNIGYLNWTVCTFNISRIFPNLSSSTAVARHHPQR